MRQTPFEAPFQLFGQVQIVRGSPALASLAWPFPVGVHSVWAFPVWRSHAWVSPIRMHDP